MNKYLHLFKFSLVWTALELLRVVLNAASVAMFRMLIVPISTSLMSYGKHSDEGAGRFLGSFGKNNEKWLELHDLAKMLVRKTVNSIYHLPVSKEAESQSTQFHSISFHPPHPTNQVQFKQAGAELCQARVKQCWPARWGKLT